MANLNKNILLNQLQELIQSDIKKNFNHLPESFNIKQAEAFETFKKRIFLESIIEETISFNKDLNWENRFDSLKLTTTAEELIEVFKLRSYTFHEIGYQNEFPDTIEGLNFDIFDKTSAVIYHENNKEITGTIRLIFDSSNKLPSEKQFSFEDMRNQYNCIGEISRNISKYRGQGLNQEFKYLMCGIYDVFINNTIDMTLSGIKKEHFKLFKKLGGVELVKELDNYGSFTEKCVIVSWDPSLTTKSFKKSFLKE